MAVNWPSYPGQASVRRRLRGQIRTSRIAAASCSTLTGSGDSQRNAIMYHAFRWSTANTSPRVCGESQRTSCPHCRQNTWPILANKSGQVVGRFGDRAHGRPTRSSHVLAGHRDGRRDAVDAVCFRLLQSLEELPRICGETFDIAALPFGIERIPGQATLPLPLRPHNTTNLRWGMLRSIDFRL